MNIQLEPHVLTNYFYPINNINSTYCTEEEEANYKEYDLFSLKTRLMAFLDNNQMGNLSIEFVPVQRGVRFFIGIRLSDAGIRAEISNQNQEKLNKAVFEITTINREYCLLFSSKTDIWIDSKTKIPNFWITSILPYLNLDNEYNPYVEDLDLYVDLSSYKSEFNDIYNKLYEKIVVSLKEFYLSGAVICNKFFADKWNLEPHILLGLSSINNQEDILDDVLLDQLTDGNGLYIPNWNDSRIAPDRVVFLTDRMSGNNIFYLYLNSDKNRQASISKYLQNQNIKYFYFTNDSLIIIDNLNYAKITKIIYEISKIKDNYLVTLVANSSDLPTYDAKWQDLQGKQYVGVNI